MANILVLDDVADAVVLLQKILRSKGHEVTGFTDEEEAIAHARSQPVDLLILDIKLKKLSGIEVLQEIKRIKPEVKAIMLTGYPTLETARKAGELGAQEYCVKPIEKEAWPPDSTQGSFPFSRASTPRSAAQASDSKNPSPQPPLRFPSTACLRILWPWPGERPRIYRGLPQIWICPCRKDSS